MNIADLIMAIKRGDDPNAAILAAAQGGGFPAVQPPDVAPIAPATMSPAVTNMLGVGAANANANLTTDAQAAAAKAAGEQAVIDSGISPRTVMPPVPIPQPRPQQPPPPPATSAPQGVATPITNPAPSEQAPRIIQSPPDLSNMYLKLIESNQNAQTLDRNLSLIAAGFSKYPEIRSGLISRAGQQSAHNLTSDDIVKLQGLQVKNQQLQIKQAAKAGLMKQYNLSRDTVDYLDSSDKLDEVIKARETGTLQIVTHGDTGQVSLYNNATHKKIADVGGPKPEEGQYVSTPQGMQLRSTRAGGAAMGEPVGAELKTQVIQTPEGQMLIDSQTGAIIAKAIGGAPTPETETFERPDKSKFIREKRTGKITEVVAPEKIGDKITDDERLLHAVNADEKALGQPLSSMKDLQTNIKRQGVNAGDIDLKAKVDADRIAAGEKPTTWAEYITKYKHTPAATATVNISPDGTQYPAPKQGFDYLRYPQGHKDAGKVQIGADGKPIQYSIEGGTGAAEKAEIEARAAKATRQEIEAQEKKNKARWHTITSTSSVLNAADRALELVNQPGATGVLAPMSRMLGFIGGKPSDSYDARIATIEASTAIQELQRMRAANETGGAIGNVTDFEQRMLAATITDLRARQQTKDAEKGLIRVKAMFKTLAENEKGYTQDPGTAGSAQFEKDLAKNIAEMEVEHANKSKSGTRTFTNIERVK